MRLRASVDLQDSSMLPSLVAIKNVVSINFFSVQVDQVQFTISYNLDSVIGVSPSL